MYQIQISYYMKQSVYLTTNMLSVINIRRITNLWINHQYAIRKFYLQIYLVFALE